MTNRGQVTPGERYEPLRSRLAHSSRGRFRVVSPRQEEPIRLFVTDLDNTLFDWFEAWYASFSAMIHTLVDLSGVPAERLEPEIREVHQRRGTSEYSYLLQELPSLQSRHPGEDLGELYRPAIDAYRRARDESLRVYPGVLETLGAIKEAGTAVVAYTESLAFYTSYRLRVLSLDPLIDFLYSPADHDFPAGVSAEDLRSRPSEEYELKHAVHRHTPAGHLKPDPAVLSSIVDESKVPASAVAYLGDSLMKDVAMAQKVGVVDVFAAYGVVQQRPEYDLLRRVSHWTQEAVEREREIASAPHVTPTFELRNSIAELLDLFEFAPSV
jgi:FMN phosphatase YigB (HAD superfamily)